MARFASAVAVCSHLECRVSEGLRVCTPTGVLPLAPTSPAGHPTRGTRRSRGIVTGVSSYLSRTSGNGRRTPGDAQVFRGRSISGRGGVALGREGGRTSTQTLPDAERHAAGSEAVNLQQVASY